MVVLLWLAIVLPCGVVGYTYFQQSIPNGGKVRDPCDGMTVWPGVGHKAMGGAGPRNPFGLSFYANSMVWNRTLCEMDSDGDGVSNGQELGDPGCVWSPGDELSTTPTGHPGICEPWSDPYCLQRNTWYSCHSKDLECEAINSAEVKNLTVTFPETAVPAKETTYMCMNFEFPSDTDYHVIADKGKIDNQYVMHHILVYACPVETTVDDLEHPLNTPFQCGMIGEAGCWDIIAIWSVGVAGFCHNEKAGFKIGASGYKYASMQLHWNNPTLATDYKDSSGMILYYTPVLRDYNLGNLMIGENKFAIPPGESRYVVDSECNAVCSERYMNGSIHITSGVNHMHYMGRAMVTSIVPKDGVEQMIMADPHYTYDNPFIHIFDSPLLVNPGDVMKTSCTYTSETKVRTTNQGESTSEEMCFAFMFYYPKEAFESTHCTTLDGIQICSLYSYTDYVDGCQIRSFLEDISTLTAVTAQIGEMCEEWPCLKECKQYIKELRKNPCLQGKVGHFVQSVLKNNVTVEQFSKYLSCDVEIALEAQTCECTTPESLPCNPYTGAAVSRQTSMYLIWTFAAAVVLLSSSTL